MLYAILGSVYVFVMPIFLWGLTFAHKKLMIERKMAKMPKNAQSKNLPSPWWPLVKERLSFARQDVRPLKLGKKQTEGGPQNRVVTLLLWSSGLVSFLLFGLMKDPKLLLVGFVLFFVCVGFALKTADTVIKARKKIVFRMFEVGKARLNLSAEYEQQPSAVVRVTDWIDLIKPNKVEYDIPTNFSSDGEENFLKLFNQVFGQETAWVADNDEQPGWDYENGKGRFRAVPPLPQKAPWKEHYITHPGVAWSFFPIGLGVENGVQIPDPETGEIEYVIGFDVSGKQKDVGPKAGLKVSPRIDTAPQVLIGGGTGGGKALASDTPVRVYVKEVPDEDAQEPSTTY